MLYVFIGISKPDRFVARSLFSWNGFVPEVLLDSSSLFRSSSDPL
jgi:hypothetical protein